MSLSFVCPRCRAPLKVRDESFVGTILDCPECQAGLVVAVSASGKIIGQERPVEKSSETPGNRSDKPRSGPARPATAPPDSFAPPPSSLAGGRTPQIIAWVIAGVCLLALIPFLIPKQDSTSPVVKPAEQPVAPPEESEKPAIAKVPANKGKTEGKAAPRPLPETPDGRLQELGKIVIDQAKADGHFPSGAVPAPQLNANQRWSWLAQVAAKHDNPNASAVDWDTRWNDPAQDRFVRRSIPRFQNPLVPTIVSEDKYPAAHYVGVAGVGADAPTLPADHPRAGIFGQNRQTTVEQIRDGASNTMLLAGVTDQLGSWASGSSSYRPFTHEPYVNGPDGFGTGQTDHMFVLMADGSVRQITQKMDPRIVRRMAAMNDGLPLDAGVPGEPGDPRPGTTPMNDPATAQAKPPGPMAKGANGAAAVEKTVEKPIDIPAALSRKILKFDQAKPAAAFQLLLQIEELAGVRIEYDREKLGPAAERLDKQITLRKDNATLEELLDEILKQIDLQRKSEATCIRIVGS